MTEVEVLENLRCCINKRCVECTMGNNDDRSVEACIYGDGCRDRLMEYACMVIQMQKNQTEAIMHDLEQRTCQKNDLEKLLRMSDGRSIVECVNEVMDELWSIAVEDENMMKLVNPVRKLLAAVNKKGHIAVYTNYSCPQIVVEE